MQNFRVNTIGRIGINKEEILIKLEPQYISALQGLNGFSHINVIWWFSYFDNEESRNILDMSKPYKKSPAIMGTFAIRSPRRPNPIALTAVKVINIDYKTGVIQIEHIDAEDNSPVLDIKPYTPSLDKVENPKVPKWCSHWPKSIEDSVNFHWENEFNF